MDKQKPKTEAEAVELLRSNIPAKEWFNFGDANPEAHGGLWAYFDGDDTITLFETWPLSHVHEEVQYHEGWQSIEKVDIYLDELVTDKGDLSDFILSAINGFSDRNRPKTVLELIHYRQNPLYYISEIIRHYGAYHLNGIIEEVRFEDYEIVKDSFGINP